MGRFYHRAPARLCSSPSPASQQPAAPSAADRGASDCDVERVADGDTIELAGGTRVRLVQIDAPELGQGECYSRQALLELAGMAPPGTRVGLERDLRLDDVDRTVGCSATSASDR